MDTPTARGGGGSRGRKRGTAWRRPDMRTRTMLEAYERGDIHEGALQALAEDVTFALEGALQALAYSVW